MFPTKLPFGSRSIRTTAVLLLEGSCRQDGTGILCEYCSSSCDRAPSALLADLCSHVHIILPASAEEIGRDVHTTGFCKLGTTGFCKLTRTTGFCKMSSTTGFCNLSGRGPPGFAIFPLVNVYNGAVLVRTYVRFATHRVPRRATIDENGVRVQSGGVAHNCLEIATKKWVMPDHPPLSRCCRCSGSLSVLWHR